MTQAERDRLVTLKKASKRLITQREAAEELKLSVRQVKRFGRRRRGLVAGNPERTEAWRVR